jgi:RNA polymerase sigma-70 factor (ECF subfamily)
MPDGRIDALTALEQTEARERLIAAISEMGERCRKLLALKLEGKSFAEMQAIVGASSINTIYTWDFRCRGVLSRSMFTPVTLHSAQAGSGPERISRIRSGRGLEGL